MLRGAGERFIPIPEGEGGALATLAHMAGLIRQPDPLVDDFTDKMSVLDAEGAALAEQIFEWVRARMVYTPDLNNGLVVEEIRTPGYLLREIATIGNALGDCDDYVVLLGALYRRLGFPVTLVAVSTHEDRQLDHVYLAVDTEEGRVAADGIMWEPFGWEVPTDEQTNRLEYPV
jgi:transglutaminase-like putative cysteine protease